MHIQEIARLAHSSTVYPIPNQQEWRLQKQLLLYTARALWFAMDFEQWETPTSWRGTKWFQRNIAWGISVQEQSRRSGRGLASNMQVELLAFNRPINSMTELIRKEGNSRNILEHSCINGINKKTINGNMDSGQAADKACWIMEQCIVSKVVDDTVIAGTVASIQQI